MGKKETCPTCGKLEYPFLHSCPGVGFEINYRWEYDLKEFPESVKIKEYVNDQLREIMDVREDIVRKAAVEILRAKGYVVIEPKEAKDD